MSAIQLPSTIRHGGRMVAPVANARGLLSNDIVHVVLGEAWRRAVPMALLFALVALLVLAVALFVLPLKYTSATTILAQESDIIQPLLEGRAVATEVSDRAGIARQVVFSRKVLEGVLEAGGWLEDAPGPLERDRLIEGLRKRTVVRSPRENLIEITYSDNNPERAFKVTEAFAELFMQETLATKERESREAYEFINTQVGNYHAKLTSAESNLQDYRSRNADAQPGSATDVNTRIAALRTQVEQTRMALMEQNSRENSLASQLSGESAVTAVQTRENLFRAQLIDLQGQLNTLLLNYTEQHPDVVRLRHQMADIQRTIEEDARRPRSTAQAGVAGIDSAQMNPLYQQLRSQLAEARREAGVTQSRLAASQAMLDGELERGRRIALSEGTLAELTRDYEVNRDIYQDLLRRRENARVSMELDQKKRGLTMRIQDPAVMPLRPTGLSPSYFAMGGFALAALLPFGLLYLLARFDPRVRSRAQIEALMPGSVITVVPGYRTARERRHLYFKPTLVSVIVGAVLFAYAAAYVVKQLSHG